jgi:hypothetical protein
VKERQNQKEDDRITRSSERSREMQESSPPVPSQGSIKADSLHAQNTLDGKKILRRKENTFSPVRRDHRVSFKNSNNFR